jgi:hypothetical protein
MHSFRLRPATLEDLDLLRRWDEQPHVIESDPNDEWNWEYELTRSPDWREQLIAEVDGRAVGFVQIIDPALEESHYWGDCPAHLRAIDIWIGEASDHMHSRGPERRNSASNGAFGHGHDVMEMGGTLIFRATLSGSITRIEATRRPCEVLNHLAISRVRQAEDCEHIERIAPNENDISRLHRDIRACASGSQKARCSMGESASTGTVSTSEIQNRR